MHACAGVCPRPFKAVCGAPSKRPSWYTLSSALTRQGDVFKKYSQMKLQMKREALKKLNRKANEGQSGFDTERPN